MTRNIPLDFVKSGVNTLKRSNKLFSQFKKNFVKFLCQINDHNNKICLMLKLSDSLVNDNLVKKKQIVCFLKLFFFKEKNHTFVTNKMDLETQKALLE